MRVDEMLNLRSIIQVHAVTLDSRQLALLCFAIQRLNVVSSVHSELAERSLATSDVPYTTRWWCMSAQDLKRGLMKSLPRTCARVAPFFSELSHIQPLIPRAIYPSVSLQRST